MTTVKESDIDKEEVRVRRAVVVVAGWTQVKELVLSTIVSIVVY